MWVAELREYKARREKLSEVQAYEGTLNLRVESYIEEKISRSNERNLEHLVH